MLKRWERCVLWMAMGVMVVGVFTTKWHWWGTEGGWWKGAGVFFVEWAGPLALVWYVILRHADRKGEGRPAWLLCVAAAVGGVVTISAAMEGGLGFRLHGDWMWGAMRSLESLGLIIAVVGVAVVILRWTPMLVWAVWLALAGLVLAGRGFYGFYTIDFADNTFRPLGFVAFGAGGLVSAALVIAGRGEWLRKLRAGAMRAVAKKASRRLAGFGGSIGQGGVRDVPEAACKAMTEKWVWLACVPGVFCVGPWGLGVAALFFLPWGFFGQWLGEMIQVFMWISPVMVGLAGYLMAVRMPGGRPPRAVVWMMAYGYVMVVEMTMWLNSGQFGISWAVKFLLFSLGAVIASGGVAAWRLGRWPAFDLIWAHSAMLGLMLACGFVWAVNKGGGGMLGWLAGVSMALCFGLLVVMLRYRVVKDRVVRLRLIRGVAQGRECRACGYDLTGTIAAGLDRCPECGMRVGRRALEVTN